MEEMNPLAQPLRTWYAAMARDLPWRAETTPWGILVSEVMLQQTPATRVIPYWQSWIARWPKPSDLAGADVADVIRAWGTLGYPRRALRLQECARTIYKQYAGEVPHDEDLLRRLPGVGEYTAAAVAAFAFGKRTVVLDTNIRRVLARAVGGEALPGPHLTMPERAIAADMVPEEPHDALIWNQSTMELGALVCRVRDPECESCPIMGHCTWRQGGYPGDAHASARRTQVWQGTNRQARGRIMAILRTAEEAVPIAAVLAGSWDESQMESAVETLINDGLIVRDGEALRLP